MHWTVGSMVFVILEVPRVTGKDPLGGQLAGASGGSRITPPLEEVGEEAREEAGGGGVGGAVDGG